MHGDHTAARPTRLSTRPVIFFAHMFFTTTSDAQAMRDCGSGSLPWRTTSTSATGEQQHFIAGTDGRPDCSDLPCEHALPFCCASSLPPPFLLEDSAVRTSSSGVRPVRSPPSSAARPRRRPAPTRRPGAAPPFLDHSGIRCLFLKFHCLFHCLQVQRGGGPRHVRELELAVHAERLQVSLRETPPFLALPLLFCRRPMPLLVVLQHHRSPVRRPCGDLHVQRGALTHCRRPGWCSPLSNRVATDPLGVGRKGGWHRPAGGAHAGL